MKTRSVLWAVRGPAKWSKLLAEWAAAAIFAVASVAQAGSLPFTGTLEIRIKVLAPLSISGAGTAIANGSAGGAHIDALALAGSTFAGTGLQVVTDPAAFPIAGAAYSAHNGAGSFAGGGTATLGGFMSLAGVVKVCLFGPCASAVANLDIPLSGVGKVGGAFITGAVNLSVVGAPWTTGTAVVAASTAMGLAHGPASATSSTFAAGGELQLVTPFFVSDAIGASAVIPGFATLTLHFVPEPATLALLAGGIALLGAIGRSRRG